MLIPKDSYPAQTDDSDPAFPEGKAQNVTVTGAGNGTPLEEDWLNDWWGFQQAAADEASITPSGVPDQVGASQLLAALKIIGKVTLIDAIKNCIPGLASSFTHRVQAGSLQAHRNDDARFVLGDAGVGSVWKQADVTSAGNLQIPLPIPPIGPAGASLSSVKVWVAPLTDHSALPATMPKFTVIQSAFTGNNPAALTGGTISAVIDDPSVNHTAYDTPHEVTIPCVAALTPGVALSLRISGETGANSQVGYTILEVRTVIVPP